MVNVSNVPVVTETRVNDENLVEEPEVKTSEETKPNQTKCDNQNSDIENSIEAEDCDCDRISVESIPSRSRQSSGKKLVET